MNKYLNSTIRTVCLISVTLLCVIACSSPKLESYSNNTPVLDVRKFFSGELSAHGIIKNRSGEVIRYFNASIHASWDKKGVGTLDEHFIFNDGEQQQRIWTLKPHVDNTFIATANDVVGESLMQTSGNALFLEYTLTLPYKNSTIDVQIDDRMYLVNPTTLLNESIMKKFGIEVGHITLVITKL